MIDEELGDLIQAIRNMGWSVAVPNVDPVPGLIIGTDEFVAETMIKLDLSEKDPQRVH